MKTAIIWFRNDLRLFDNPAVYHAIKENDAVILIYIFDANLSNHHQTGEAQQWWLINSLQALNSHIKILGANLIVQQGKCLDIILALIKKTNANCIYWNTVYEPDVLLHDQTIKKALLGNGIAVQEFNTSLLTDPQTIYNKMGDRFKVFTPYWRHCLTQIHTRKIYPLPEKIQGYTFKDCQRQDNDLLSSMIDSLPTWAKKFKSYWHPGEKNAQSRWQNFSKYQLNDYGKLRDFPAEHGTSTLSPSLHFGEISVYQLYHQANQCIADKNINYHSLQRFITEIGWREFCYYSLYHFPALPNTNFNRKFDGFTWINNPQLLAKWQTGQTGYPIIDAGMRELWETGIMHNRVRMIVASFLIKDLLIDWREGEKWFWNTLVDADLASNSANWQWVAGSGADAAPYFRIFNPILQGQKFDAQGIYIKKWIPELKNLPQKYIHTPWLTPEAILKDAHIILGKTYPYPLVDHAKARENALAIYNKL